MEKFAVRDDDLIEGLRNEEHELMLKVAGHMIGIEKTAEQERDYQSAQNRLQMIRDKITDHDLKKTRFEKTTI